MTVPAVTVPATASVVMAGRRMDERGVKRLIVVADNDTLRGIVSRRDLLQVFVRPDVGDADIASEIREDVLERSPWMEAPSVKVKVRQGAVTPSGWMERRSETAIAMRVIARVDGVVDVIDELQWRHDTFAWGK
ncbi:CBS domain-containing protein [Nonomuraea jabiensis]|uniref:CBS domain-containing protein n=1 Tax=Nonomuraea jabiensis TaxID=882448 RepID=UPI003D75A70F